MVFDHWLHRAKFTCRLCHVDIGFAMEAEATDISAADNMNGYFCGACHDGKRVIEDKEIFAACAAEFTKEVEERCARCHSQGTTGKRKYDFKTFAENLPRLAGNSIDWEKAEADWKNESPRSKLRGIKTFCSVLLLAASRGELYPKLD